MNNFGGKKGYSTVTILVIIGFLMVLTVGIFNLVLREMQDNRYMGNAIKAYAGAESAQELALLQIKKYGYGYYDSIEMLSDERSKMLIANPLDLSSYIKGKDVIISYDIGSKVNLYNGELESNGYHIIPLFYLDESGEYKTNAIDLDIQGDAESIVWNVISQDSGIGGVGMDNQGIKKSFSPSSEGYLELDLTSDRNDFLRDPNNNSNYIVLYNSSTVSKINYILKSQDPGEYFSKPITYIESSAKLGDIRQNLRTKLDNTDFLGILKYVIYSN